MKTTEELKKYSEMTKIALYAEYKLVDKKLNMSIFEITSKKLKDVSKVNKLRKSKARILTILTTVTGDDNGSR